MSKKIVLAFSGGLDTSFCVPFLKKEYDGDVITVTVDTGGFSQEELNSFEAKSKKLGASKHITVDAKQKVYEKAMWLIKSNALRGGVYPLCVGVERFVQAEDIVKIAKSENANAIAHGSTGAGNDQIRFDVAFNALAPELELITPVRDLGWSREQEGAYLHNYGFEVSLETKDYSFNEGIWGITIGGKETHNSWDYPPESVFKLTKSIQDAPENGLELSFSFEKGIPVAINGKDFNGVELAEFLNVQGGLHGVGRGVHLGDTILGLKGRILFEAPAALILIKAHSELEKLVLSKSQLYWKKSIDQLYADMVHHGQLYDPLFADLEAFINSTQKYVSGQVKVILHKGNINVVGMKSDYSLMNDKIASYGEENSYWSGSDASGFSKLFGLSSVLSALTHKE